MFKLLLAVDGELVNTHFVGLSRVSIVILNDLEVFEENHSPVNFFGLIEVSIKGSLPLFEFEVRSVVLAQVNH